MFFEISVFGWGMIIIFIKYKFIKLDSFDPWEIREISQLPFIFFNQLSIYVVDSPQLRIILSMFDATILFEESPDVTPFPMSLVLQTLTIWIEIYSFLAKLPVCPSTLNFEIKLLVLSLPDPSSMRFLLTIVQSMCSMVNSLPLRSVLICCPNPNHLLLLALLPLLLPFLLLPFHLLLKSFHFLYEFIFIFYLLHNITFLLRTLCCLMNLST